MFYWWEIHMRKNFLESFECFGKLSTKRNDNGWVESSCCRKYILDSTKERIVRLNYSFFWQFVCMKTHIYTLYEVKIDVFKINKMLYGILIFIVEIYLIYLYNTYRERLLEKQWLLWNKINAEALIFFHCHWWLVLFAFFYNNQCYF